MKEETKVEPTTQLIETEISTLENMNTMLSKPDTQQVQNARIDTPSEVVEKKLSEFVADAFSATNKDLEFNEKLKSELVNRLPSLSDNQIIALFSNTNVNLNDKMSKLIAPTVGLMTAEKQAEIQAQQRKEQAQNQILINASGNPVNGPNQGTGARLRPVIPINASTLRITAAAGTELAGASSVSNVKYLTYSINYLPPNCNCFT